MFAFQIPFHNESENGDGAPYIMLDITCDIFVWFDFQ
jgi:hypothetical protein